MQIEVFKNFHAALALLLADGATPSDCRKLALPPEEIFESLKTHDGLKQISGLLDKPVGPVEWKSFETQVLSLERIDGKAVCLWDEEYPDYLHEIAQAPPVVFYKGTLDGVYRRGVAIVGTRKPSAPGARLARSLGRELAAMGIPVVSGLARGIDSAAHNGSLDGGGGGIAVIGTGLNVPYPPENAELMLDVARNGCVITEQQLGATALPYVFPMRNRLISAFSHAVVVVEAGGRSGALITVKWALEQGRDVGAVPGFPGDFRSRGTNGLLRQGAFVVEAAKDIVAAVPRLAIAETNGGHNGAVCEDMSTADTAHTDAENSVSQKRIRAMRRDRTDAERLFSTLNKTPADADSLARHVGMDVTVVQRLLLHLEMAGRVERDSLGRYTGISVR